MNLDNFLFALLGAFAMLVAAIAAGAKEYIAAFFRKLAKNVEKEKRTYAHGVQRIADFHKFLEHIGRFDFVDRLLVFTGTNCGGVPDPKKPYVVKCFYGWSSLPGKNPERLYDFPLKVDYHYVKLILEMLEKGCVTIEISKLPDDCQLKTYYTAEGVHTSIMYQLHISETELIYISIANYTKGFDSLEEGQIDLSIDRIRSILSEE